MATGSTLTQDGRRGYSRRVAPMALVCQASGFWALAVLGFAVIFYRLERITATQFLWAIGLVVLLIVVAYYVAFPALKEFFERDALGVGAVARGVLLATLAASPLIFFGAQAVVKPRLNDISTDLDSPPVFDELAQLRRETAFPSGNRTDVTDAVQADAYPAVGPHRYATNVGRVAEAVSDVVAARGWQIVAEPDLPSVTPREEGVIPLPSSPLPPSAFEAGEAYIFEAIHRSLVLREPSDVVIRLTSDSVDQEGRPRTLVDMRVAVRHTAHDFGIGARLIEGFLADLDVELLGVAGEGLVVDETEPAAN